VKKINPNLYPSTGFKFKDPSTGVTFVGSNWGGVAARVASYRKRNGIAPGNPTEEVMAQACANNPGHCVESNGVTEAQLKIVSLKGRIFQWFNELKKRRVREGQLPLVDNETYLRRAGTCLNCPFKQGLDEGCGSCRSAIKQLRREVIDGRPEYAGLLMTGCQILGTDLPTAVHLDEITVDNKQLPDNCWRKRTIT
jgi:hypothetical protein